jgi:hypothetical protein
MSFFRRGDTSNTIIGIIMLVALLVFVGPNVLPSILARTLPFFDEGIPCSNLRVSENRARHQSLIGRQAVDPLVLDVETSALPQQAGENLVITITITNITIGTVPIVFSPDQVIVGDASNSSGVGLIFNPPSNVQTTGFRRAPGSTTFLEEDIRLLGPRQKCVHRVEFPADQLDNVIRSGATQVQAYYRITGAGAITANAQNPNPIYPDQGLAIISGGIVTSDPLVITQGGSR